MGDRVYTQVQSLSKQEVLCFDANTGETVWSHRYGWPYDPAGMYPGPRATPTWRDGRVFFAGPCGLVGCLDAATGRPIWSLNVTETFCRRLSLAIEWIFLLGFLPSWPIAVPAAYRLDRTGPPWRDILWAVLSFTAYFWASAGIVLSRTAAG